MRSLIIALTTMLGFCLTGCQAEPTRQERKAVSPEGPKRDLASTNTPIGNDDEKLVKLVDQLAANGNEADSALGQLRSYPKPELTGSLGRIQNALATDDPQRVFISFALCNLNYDYEDNKKIVLDAFLRKRPYGQKFDVDWAASLIARLMELGDDGLLPIVFSAAEKADGAMAEELGGVYLHKWRSDPKVFLIGLKSAPITARRQVYFLLVNDELLTAEDRSKMRSYLRSAPHDPSVGPIAKEMLAAIPRLERQRRENEK